MLGPHGVVLAALSPTFGDTALGRSHDLPRPVSRLVVFDTGRTETICASQDVLREALAVIGWAVVAAQTEGART